MLPAEQLTVDEIRVEYGKARLELDAAEGSDDLAAQAASTAHEVLMKARSKVNRLHGMLAGAVAREAGAKPR